MLLEIRIATEKEAAILSQLGRDTYTEAFGGLFKDYAAELEQYLNETFALQKMQNSLRRPSNTFLLAYDGNTPVGYAKLKKQCSSEALEPGNSVQLQKIYVLKEYLGKKVGVALLTNGLKLASLETPHQIWLSVLQSNEKAIGFYEKFGFKKVGAHSFTIGSQEFLFHKMSKVLQTTKMAQVAQIEEVNIVQAGTADLPELVRLFEAYRLFYRQPSNPEQATAFLRQRIENQESVVFLALSATGKGLGFTQLYPLFSSLRMQKIWLLNDIYVDDTQRGKGIGIQLLKKAKVLARQSQAAGLVLETEKSNVVGNTLYPRTGFKLDTEHNHYSWDTPLHT